jgi:hypothetical protein
VLISHIWCAYNFQVRLIAPYVMIICPLIAVCIFVATEASPVPAKGKIKIQKVFMTNQNTGLWVTLEN